MLLEFFAEVGRVFNPKGFVFAILISFAILAIWYALEWMQFGELQWGRNCDEVVFILYFFALWIGFGR